MSERDSYNDVLRDLLKLPKYKAPLSAEELARATSQANSWWVKHVIFPPGTEFRAIYKGKTHTATIKDGALLVAGRKVRNPSAAARLITGKQRQWLALLGSSAARSVRVAEA